MLCRCLSIPLNELVPRLWAFLYHPSSSVRKATAETLVTLTTCNAQWVQYIVGDALRHIYQRCLLEHNRDILAILPKVNTKMYILIFWHIRNVYLILPQFVGSTDLHLSAMWMISNIQFCIHHK